MGWSLYKARCVSDHRDAARRLAWLEDKGPALVRAAERPTGVILFEDEARCAQWGALSDPWARRGPQPAGPPSGKRKGSKVLGTMAYFSGRLCCQSLEGRCTSDSSRAFLPMILAQTTAHVLLSHAGAQDHTSKATQQFLAAHRERLTAHPLPSYSPDDNPSEYRGKQTKTRATPNQSLQKFTAMTVSVDKALVYFATYPEMVLALFGRYCDESGLERKQAA